MKHDYEDTSMLTLPETIAQSLYCCLGEVKHQVTIIGFVRLSVGVSSCSCLHSHASYSIPVLSPFLFMLSLYALLFVILYLLVPTHFIHGYTDVYKVSFLCVLLLVSLRSEEMKVPFCWWLSWK